MHSYQVGFVQAQLASSTVRIVSNGKKKDTKVKDIPEETKDAAEEAPTEAKAKRKT